MSLFKRFRLVLMVLPVVVVIALIKLAIHLFNLEFLSLEGLFPSIVAGAIFLIGFLLSHTLSDYKEAERIVGDMRVALETLYADISAFGQSKPDFDFPAIRAFVTEFIDAFEHGLSQEHAHAALGAAITKADDLLAMFVALENAGMSDRYVVRLRGAHDVLRRSLYRVAYMQRMQFVPSVHVMVQSLVFASLVLMLFLKTTAVVEGALIIGFVAYMLVYAIILIEQLEKPFRTGEGTVDDVSIFLLRDFEAKLKAG
jgi:hypothetical protein